MADLDAASLENVKQWFRDNYGPNNAVLVLAGDIDGAEARPLVVMYFGDLPRGPENVPAAAAGPTLGAPAGDIMTERAATTRNYRARGVIGLIDEKVGQHAIVAADNGSPAPCRAEHKTSG